MPGRKGVIDTSRLHRLRAGNTKVFRRETIARGVNTAVHILLDSSGSMTGKPISIAVQACFAVAKSLASIKGVNPAVTAFSFPCYEPEVYPLVRHGEQVTDKVSIPASGGTPLAPALWWTLQTMNGLREARKIILVITDGLPDNPEQSKKVLECLHQFQYEVYGIGIDFDFIKALLPENSIVIKSLEELAPAMFGMLQEALLQ